MRRPGPVPPSEAVAAALREHRDALRGFVRARVPSSDVDDVLQVAAVRAVERAASLREPEHALAWLYQLHRNVIVDAQRRRASRARVAKGAAIDPTAVESGSVSAPELCDCSVFQAMQLREGYAEILRLVDLGDHTTEEAAHVLGVTPNNASVRLHRARAALRRRLQEHCGVTSFRDCLGCRCVEDGCCAA